MRRLVIPTIVALVANAWTLYAADSGPRVDAVLTTQGEIWQGQRIVVTVTLKTPDTFASAPAFDLPQIPGAILVPPAGRPTLGTEAIGDDSYTTQSHELNLIPQHAGEVVIPSYPIRFDSAAGYGKPTHARKVLTPVVSFTVKAVPGVESSAIVLTTSKFEVSETWQPDLGKGQVRVGSAFTRTIRVNANELPGLVLPKFQTDFPDGLRVYERQPLVNDEQDRGNQVGHRTDTITIICERPGTYEIPSMSARWWNPLEQQLNSASLPTHSIVVTDTTDIVSNNEDKNSPVSSLQGRRWLPIAWVLSGGIVGLAYFAVRALKDHGHSPQTTFVTAERRAFSVVRSACRSGDARAVYRAILNWRDLLETGSDSRARLTNAVFNADAAFLSELDRLETSLFGLPGTPIPSRWSSDRFLACSKQFRRRWKWQQRQIARRCSLPRLNPSQTECGNGKPVHQRQSSLKKVECS